MVPCMGNPHWGQDQNPHLVEPGPPPGQGPPPSAAGKTRPSSQTRDRVWAESSVDHELAVHFLSLSRKHWATTHTAPGNDQHTPGWDSNHRALVVALGPTRAEPRSTSWGAVVWGPAMRMRGQRAHCTGPLAPELPQAPPGPPRAPPGPPPAVSLALCSVVSMKDV
ncbi:unnamed protein product [Arctogadus glacialis]